eukprot:1177603-Prorocentrum_minimum.AAC.1
MSRFKYGAQPRRFACSTLAHIASDAPSGSRALTRKHRASGTAGSSSVRARRAKPFGRISTNPL